MGAMNVSPVVPMPCPSAFCRCGKLGQVRAFHQPEDDLGLTVEGHESSSYSELLTRLRAAAEPACTPGARQQEGN